MSRELIASFYYEQSVSVDLVSRETLVSELKKAAEPLLDSCTPEVSARVEAAVEEAVQAYSTTCKNLNELCNKYQNAAELWKRYREASDLVNEWVDSQMESVGDLEPEEAINTVKVSTNFIFIFDLFLKGGPSIILLCAAS